MIKKLLLLCVALVCVLVAGCSGQRNDIPAKNSEAQSALEKGIPKSAVDGSRKNQQTEQQPPAPEVTP